MFKNTKRAERRHHYRRLKKARVDYHYWGRGTALMSWTKAHLGMAVETPCSCSCPMCGNPRKHFSQRTLAELKSQGSSEEQLLDYLEND